MQKYQIGFLVIFLLSFLAWRALVQPGFFPIHDDQHVARLWGLDEALRSGQFPVRWVSNLGFGYGYPLFIFYPPLVYYLAEIFNLFGFSLIWSVKITFLIAFLGAGFFMYILAKEFFGTAGGILASLFYIYTPYFAVDTYVRGALAESFSFVFLPLIFWAFYKLAKTNNKKFVILSGLSFALLVITHSLIALPFVPLLLFYLLILVFISSNKLLTIRHTLFAIVLAIGLSAFFWIPALWEKKHTLVDQILLADLANYKIHFVYLSQLWTSIWGYGGSAAGLLDGLSFKIGKLHIVLTVFSVFVGILLWRKRKEASIYIFSFFFLFIFSAFMTTSFSGFLWDRLQPLWYLQFPWRFLIFTSFSASFLAGALFAFPTLAFFRYAKFGLVIVLLFLLIWPNLKLFQPKFLNFDVQDEDYTQDLMMKWVTSSTSFEYIPKGVSLKRVPPGISFPDIEKEEIAMERFSVLTGEEEVHIVEDKPHALSLKSKGGSKKIRFNIFSFPGWNILIDGVKVPFSDQNKLRLITVGVPSGNHIIEARFQNTPPRTFGNFISAVSIVVLIFALSFERIKRWIKIPR